MSGERGERGVGRGSERSEANEEAQPQREGPGLKRPPLPVEWSPCEFEYEDEDV